MPKKQRKYTAAKATHKMLTSNPCQFLLTWIWQAPATISCEPSKGGRQPGASRSYQTFIFPVFQFLLLSLNVCKKGKNMYS